jgi:hypothetical protein
VAPIYAPPDFTYSAGGASPVTVNAVAGPTGTTTVDILSTTMLEDPQFSLNIFVSVVLLILT